MNLNFHQKKKKKFLHPSITLPSARYQIRVKVSKGIQLDKEHGSKRRKSGRSWSGHRGGRSNTRVFVVGPPSLWLRQHVSVPGSESFRPATRYFKWSLGRSVVIALRWNIGRLFLAAAYSSTTTSATLPPPSPSLLHRQPLHYPTLAGVAAEPAYPPKNTTHRLRHPPNGDLLFPPPLFYCFSPSPLFFPPLVL